MLSTDKQTNRQTKQTDKLTNQRYQKHNLLGNDNAGKEHDMDFGSQEWIEKKRGESALRRTKINLALHVY